MTDDFEIVEPDVLDEDTARYIRNCARALMISEGIDRAIVDRIVSKLTIDRGPPALGGSTTAVAPTADRS